MPDPVAEKPKRSWWKRHGRTVLFFSGLVGSFVCPHLSPAVAGPCKIIMSVLRTGAFDGTEIPIPSDLEGSP